MLDQSTVASYLLSLGLVNPRTVVDGDLAVADTSRRNAVFVVTATGRPTLVVKAASPDTAATVNHEAAVLRALGRIPALAGHVPAVVHHDAGRARLVLRTPAGAPDWSAHQAAGRFPSLPARALGRLLATVHAIPPAAVEPAPAGVEPMWGLSLPAPRYAGLLDMSAGARDLVERLQASARTCARLDEVRASVADDALVHGDLRWDNCLAVAAPGARRRTRVLVIDWELAGRGTAAFDVGTVIAEYLRVWVGSIPIVAAADPGRFVAHARHPLEAMQRPIGAFWSAYRRASARALPLRRVVELTAVRLLQIAMERASGANAPTAHVMTLVQLADNMLASPDVAAWSILGLEA
jgi:Ser/Thr protein kinase RdoA (MazF antagonist)